MLKQAADGLNEVAIVDSLSNASTWNNVLDYLWTNSAAANSLAARFPTDSTSINNFVGALTTTAQAALKAALP
jgi:hypothetical protein